MKKNLLIIGLIFLITALVLNMFYGWFTMNKQEKIANEVLKPNNDTITLREYITKDSTIYVKYEPNLGQLLQNNVTPKTNNYISDTLAPALKIAASKIKEFQQVKAKLEGNVQSLKSELDKEKNRTTFYKDKYFTATTKTDTLGNSLMAYNYNAQLDIVTEAKRKNFLSKEVQTIYISSPDKNMKINNVEHFKKDISIPPKKWGLGIQVGYYYVPEKNSLTPGVGLGLSYNLIRF